MIRKELKMTTIKQIIKDSFQKNRHFLMLSVISGAIRSYLMLMPTYFIAQSLNNLSEKQGVNRFYFSVFMIVFCQIIVMILYVADTYFNRYVFQISYKIKTSLFASIFSIKNVTKKIDKPEQIIINGLEGANQVSEFYYRIISNLTWYVSTIIGAVYLMTKINLGIALLIIFLTLIQLFIINFLKTSFQQNNANQKNVQKEQLSYLNLIIENNEYLKINNEEQDFLTTNTVDLLNAELKVSMKNTMLHNITENINSIFNIVKQCLILYISYNLFQNNKIEIGDVIALNSYIVWIIPVLRGLHNLIKDHQVNLNNIELISNYIDVLPASVVKLMDKDKELVITDLELLKIRVLVGKILFIKGNSGSGKTSLVEGLLKLNNHYEKKILINGTYIERYSREDLLNEIIICPQHPMMLEKTIKENIVLKNDSITDDELDIMLSHLNLNFSDLKHNNLDALSYGEQKRIMILRTVLLDRQVYVFDEPTSGLDEINRHRVLELIQKHLKNKRIIIITHDNLDGFDYEYDVLSLN